MKTGKIFLDGDNPIMIIEEDKNMLRILDIDIDDSINEIHFKNKYFPHVNYYKVNCQPFIKLGLDANDILEAVYYKYIRSDFQPLNKCFNEIERM